MLGGNLDRRSHHNAETPFRLGVDRQQAIALACAAMEIVCHALMRRWLLCVRAQSVFSTLLCPRQANHEHNARDARSSSSDELALRHIKRLVAFFPIRLIVPGISPACGSRFPWPISSRVVNLSAAPRSAGLSRASRTAACPPASEASCRLNGRIFPPCAREARARRVSSAPDLPFYFDPFLRWARQDSLLITPPLLWSSLLHCLCAFRFSSLDEPLFLSLGGPPTATPCPSSAARRRCTSCYPSPGPAPRSPSRSETLTRSSSQAPRPTTTPRARSPTRMATERVQGQRMRQEAETRSTGCTSDAGSASSPSCVFPSLSPRRGLVADSWSARRSS